VATLLPLCPNAVALMTWGMVPVRWSGDGRAVPAMQRHRCASGAEAPVDDRHRRAAAPTGGLRDSTIPRTPSHETPRQ
jgi:hypothetical protein